MNLVWLGEAGDDVRRLFDFLIAKDSEAAGRMLARVREGAQTLLVHPRGGKRMDDESERRELFVPFGVGAYVLRYRVRADRTVVIRVWHSRESRSG